MSRRRVEWFPDEWCKNLRGFGEYASRCTVPQTNSCFHGRMILAMLEDDNLCSSASMWRRCEGESAMVSNQHIFPLRNRELPNLD